MSLRFDQVHGMPRAAPMVVATAPTGPAPKHKGKAIMAGGIAGMVEICCTYPIEFTKTMQQLSTTGESVKDVVSNTVKRSGPMGMYKGLDSMIYFATPKAAIRFGGKEAFSGMLLPGGQDVYGLGKLNGFISGLGAGTLEAIFVTTPQETLKIKLIDDQFKSATPRFNGFFHGVTTIVKEEGFAGVYHGLAPTVFKVATAQATRFGVFEVVPAEWRKGPINTAAAGAFAGGVSVIIFQGIDVVKSRMQGLDAAKYSSTMDCAQKLYAEGGVGAFYKGVGPRMTRVCFEVAITMSLYGEVVKFLDSVWKTE